MTRQAAEHRPDSLSAGRYPQGGARMGKRHVGQEHQHLPLDRPDMAQRGPQAAPHPFGARSAPDHGEPRPAADQYPATDDQDQAVGTGLTGTVQGMLDQGPAP